MNSFFDGVSRWAAWFVGLFAFVTIGSNIVVGMAVSVGGSILDFLGSSLGMPGSMDISSSLTSFLASDLVVFVNYVFPLNELAAGMLACFAMRYGFFALKLGLFFWRNVPVVGGR